jgi:hydrogenase nickel incorporation protein HypB
VHEKNSVTADEIRSLLDKHRVRMINVMGGAGCGKTCLLERVLPALSPIRCAVLEGDIATVYDAERIAELQVPVCQLQTEGACHLDAALVLDGLRALPLADLDLVFVENVGNLVCPAEFDIGEHERLAVLSIMEGHDKPAKYPLLFTRATAVALSKCDLQDRADFDWTLAVERIRQLNRDAPIFVTGRNCAGDRELLDWIADKVPGAAVQRRRTGATDSETPKKNAPEEPIKLSCLEIEDIFSECCHEWQE